MKKTLIIATLIVALHFCLCGYVMSPAQEQTQVCDFSTMGNWLNLEIWNNGVCDLTNYCNFGTDTYGRPMDVAGTLARFKMNAMKLAYYDACVKSYEINCPEMYKLVCDWEILKNEIWKAYVVYMPYSNSLPVGNEIYNPDLLGRYIDEFQKDLEVFGY